MGYPWPKTARADGTGTSSADLQRIIGAQYVSTGVLPNGGLTVEGTSSMAYKVNAGACFMWVSYDARLGMLVPVDTVTVNTLPAPSTGSRIDTVFVDGDGAVRVVSGSDIPSGVAIARFTVPAGITATTSAQQSIDRNFAIATGASLGQLYKFHDPATNGTIGNVAAIGLGYGRFNLPSDRLVRFDMTHCISVEQNTDPSTGEATVMRWRVYIDNVLELAFTTRAEWDNPQTNFMSFSKALAEGPHTVHYQQDRLKGARFVHHKGTSAGYAGNRFEIWDAGVTR